jgi:protein-S-isoprenylcysteine O-methyltransferase Ste14
VGSLKEELAPMAMTIARFFDWFQVAALTYLVCLGFGRGLALPAFGDSWRLGIDRETSGPLVTHGVFAWTRNPIYVGLDSFALGTFLVQGRLIFLALALVSVGMLQDQIRREERFLARAYGGAYREYCARVGRYVKWQ